MGPRNPLGPYVHEILGLMQMCIVDIGSIVPTESMNPNRTFPWVQKFGARSPLGPIIPFDPRSSLSLMNPLAPMAIFRTFQ